MINNKDTNDIFTDKKSVGKLYETFINEFSNCYELSDKTEKNFLEKSVNQFFRRYYYSAVEPDKYVTPANIIAAFAEREFGNDVFVPTFEVVKSNGNTDILPTLHYVNKENHHMVRDFETVLRICKTGLRTNKYGIPDDGQRKRFEGKIFLDDRHYLNIIVLTAIELGFMSMSNDGRTIVTTVTQKLHSLLSMTVKEKINMLVDGIIGITVESICMQVPKLNEVITKDVLWNLVKNPVILKDIIDTVNNRVCLYANQIDMKIGCEEVSNDRFEDLLYNSSESPFIMFFIEFDVYFFTPLSYYLQLINPFYSCVYDLKYQSEDVFFVLKKNYDYARNSLFYIPTEFDLTPLGEEILLGGSKLKSKKKLNKNYEDKDFLNCFQLREQYLTEGTEFDSEVFDNLFNPFDYTQDNVPINGKKNFKSLKPLKCASAINDELYVFKVKDCYAKRNWVIIEIQGKSTLERLHDVISDEFYLEPFHLYSFFMSGVFWDESTEYSHREGNARNKANKAKIGSVGIAEGSKFVFLYDYGDELKYEIECTQVLKQEKGKRYPKVVKKSKSLLEN